LTDALAKNGGWAQATVCLVAWSAVLRHRKLACPKKKSDLGRGASLLKVFWPYLTWNTVFDNSRVVAETGRRSTSNIFFLCLSFCCDSAPQIDSAIRPDLGPQKRGGEERNRECRNMTDLLLVMWVSALIELTRLKWMLGGGTRWEPGRKAAFGSSRATTARGIPVPMFRERMLSRCAASSAPGNTDFSVMTQSFDRTKGLFRRN